MTQINHNPRLLFHKIKVSKQFLLDDFKSQVPILLPDDMIRLNFRNFL